MANTDSGIRYLRADDKRTIKLEFVIEGNVTSWVALNRDEVFAMMQTLKLMHIDMIDPINYEGGTVQ